MTTFYSIAFLRVPVSFPGPLYGVQAAWYSSIGLGVAWVIFRFVGPNLGLYKLANDIQTPNF